MIKHLRSIRPLHRHHERDVPLHDERHPDRKRRPALPVHALPARDRPVHDQRPRGDKQTGARIDEARRQLAENNVLAILIDEGVAGVGSATADTNIHILVFRDEGGNLPLAFRTILTANYNPKTHD